MTSEADSPTDGTALLVRQLDDVWGHAYESVAVALKDVTEDEAAWQPPGYADEPPEAGWPPRGSVRWHVAHLAACTQDYACMLRDRGGPVDLGGVAFTPAPSYAEDLAQLEAAHAWLRSELAALPAAELGVKVNGTTPAADFLAAVIRHDAWHAGQIVVTRRLYRAR